MRQQFFYESVRPGAMQGDQYTDGPGLSAHEKLKPITWFRSFPRRGSAWCREGPEGHGRTFIFL